MSDSKKFELFLDESGDFSQNDLDETQKPSLIGGLLAPEKTLTEENAKDICGEEYTHISESNQASVSVDERRKVAQKAMKVITKAHELNGVSFVIWQNNERIKTESPSDLYFLMMTEGITNVIENLSVENQDVPIELKVYISVKVIDPNTKYDNAHDAVWSEKEYVNRLLNNIKARIEKENIYINKDSKITIETGSAKKVYKLMIQDVICNTYLTRDSKKFIDEEKKKIKELYKSVYISNINKPDYQKELAKALSQNNIIDIFFLAFEMRNRKNSNDGYVIEKCIQALNNIDSKQLDLQNNLLLTKLELIINVKRELNFAEKFLNMIDTEILQKVKNNSPEFKKLKFDVALYEFTVHTHLGKNFESGNDIKICKPMLEDTKELGNLKYIEYSNIFANRVSVYYMDCLNHELAVNCLEEPIFAFSLINDALSKLNGMKNIKSEDLGKLLGTRLQAYTCLVSINENNQEVAKNYYELAKADSELALENFTLQGDIARQYNYRSSLETEIGNIEEAIKFLYKGVMVKELENTNYENSMKELCAEIGQIKDSSKYFTICQYVKIMYKANKIGKRNIAKILYDALQNENDIKQIIEGKKMAVLSVNDTEVTQNVDDKLHPFELIYFYYGDFLNDSHYIDKAIQVCENLKDSLTLQIFEISAKAKKCIMALGTKNEEKFIKDLIKFVDKIYNKNYINSENKKDYPTNEILAEIKSDIEKINYEKENILNICNEIIRKIKI